MTVTELKSCRRRQAWAVLMYCPTSVWRD